MIEAQISKIKKTNLQFFREKREKKKEKKSTSNKLFNHR
jgi:hypothetical protein